MFWYEVLHQRSYLMKEDKREKEEEGEEECEGKRGGERDLRFEIAGGSLLCNYDFVECYLYLGSVVVRA